MSVRTRPCPLAALEILNFTQARIRQQRSSLLRSTSRSTVFQFKKAKHLLYKINTRHDSSAHRRQDLINRFLERLPIHRSPRLITSTCLSLSLIRRRTYLKTFPSALPAPLFYFLTNITYPPPARTWPRNQSRFSTPMVN